MDKRGGRRLAMREKDKKVRKRKQEKKVEDERLWSTSEVQTERPGGGDRPGKRGRINGNAKV